MPVDMDRQREGKTENEKREREKRERERERERERGGEGQRKRERKRDIYLKRDRDTQRKSDRRKQMHEGISSAYTKTNPLTSTRLTHEPDLNEQSLSANRYNSSTGGTELAIHTGHRIGLDLQYEK